MGKQSRAATRAKAAAPAMPPSQTMTEDQLTEMRSKFARQQKFNGFVAQRPVPSHWHPVMQFLATLEKVADVRYSDETLRELTDDQIVHGLMSENITVYKARVGTYQLTQYSVRQTYPKPRWPITPVDNSEVFFRDFQKQMFLERIRPLLAPEVLLNGRLNIPAYFAALETIRANDEQKAAEQRAAAVLADGAKDIAARIADGKLEYRHAGNVGKSLTTEQLVGGFVQVETKKPDGAQQQAEAGQLVGSVSVDDVVVDAQDPVAVGLATERQAEVDAVFDASLKQAPAGTSEAITAVLEMSDPAAADFVYYEEKLQQNQQ